MFSSAMLAMLYPALGGVAVGIIVSVLNPILEKVNARKYAPLLANVYNVVDPLLDKYYSGWDGSTIDTVLELAFHSVSDGTLSDEEAAKAVQMAKEKFLPDVAKSKTLDESTEAGQKALEIAQMVKRLTEGVNKDELIAIAKTSVPMSVPTGLFKGLF